MPGSTRSGFSTRDSGLLVPAELIGQAVDLGTITVTREMIHVYAASVDDHDTLAGDCLTAPPTFFLSLRRGMTPEVTLPPDSVSMYGGHDLIFHRAIRAGKTYCVRARLADVYEKSGRSGPLTIIVREALAATLDGTPVIEIVERQIIRRTPVAADGATDRQ
jgi:acyl dehydratase